MQRKRVLVATNGRGGAHCMKFSVTHHAGQATTAQLGQRLSPLNFRLFALPLICEMESSKITIKEFRQRLFKSRQAPGAEQGERKERVS